MTLKKTLWLGAGTLVLAGAAWALVHYGGALARAVERRRHPDVPRAASPLAAVMDADIRKRKLDAFNGESRRLSALVEEAGRSGYDSAPLRERLEHASRLAEEGRFSEASMLLNIVEIRLPRSAESVAPAGEEQAAPSDPKARRKARRHRSGR